MEIWKDIEGYEGAYQVSSLGRVKNLARYTNVSGGAKSFKRERILKYDKSKKNKRGQSYLRVTLSKENKQKRLQVHRIVAEHFIDKPEGKDIINHIDGNPENNHYLNLEWCTHSENERHSYDVLGKVNGNRKLSISAVNDIKINAVKGINRTKKGNVIDFMNKYNVDRRTILNVLNEKYYVSIEKISNRNS